MSDEAAGSAFLVQLARWSGEELLRDSCRVRLICPQPQHGDYGYLHRLYPGLTTADIAELEATVGQAIPSRLREFYSLTNGASLFEGQVSVSGLVTDFSRDPARELPISIEQDNLAFSALRPNWHRRDYFRVGGVSFLRQDEIICGPDDCIIILHAQTGEQLRGFTDIFECLESFTREMSQFWTDDGIFVGDWDALDALVLQAKGTA